MAADLVAEEVALPVRARADGLFAVRATGDSMDGGTTPIRDGDWLVFKHARGAGLGAIAGRVALLQTELDGDHGFQVKRLTQEGEQWLLRSDNPERPSYAATAATVPIAMLIDVFRPEDLSPAPGTVLDANELRETFGIEDAPTTGRVRGHLVIAIAQNGVLVEPDRVQVRVADRRPGETAFVLARVGEAEEWRYCGVGRVTPEDESVWAIPEVDFATWRAMGHGRETSRRLPAGAEERARGVVEAVMSSVGEGGWIEGNGKRCRVVARSAQGGLRIDGGRGGFSERTVSLRDIAWTVVAGDDVRVHGGVLDEARVNRLRYLEGTPKGSTRWIDSGWAVVVTEAVIGASVRESMM